MFQFYLLHSTIRGDEKLLIQAAQKRRVKLNLIDIRQQIFSPHFHPSKKSIALERSVSTIKGDHATTFFESRGITVVNSSTVASLCKDKFATSLVLYQNQIATPDFALVFSLEQAKTAISKMGGYPVILKPTLGSWGRLLAKINDEDSLESLIEHKEVLGSPPQKAFYLQQYINKPARDIRVFIIDHQPLCAIYRQSTHWITNTARGGKTTACRLNQKLSDICIRASQAVGGGVLAIDVLETNTGYSVNEINHTMEFKNSELPTKTSISGAIIDHCLKIAQEKNLL